MFDCKINISLSIGETQNHEVRCSAPKGSVLEPDLWTIFYDALLEIGLPIDVEFIIYVDVETIVGTAKLPITLVSWNRLYGQWLIGWTTMFWNSLLAKQRPFFWRTWTSATTWSSHLRDIGSNLYQTSDTWQPPGQLMRVDNCRNYFPILKVLVKKEENIGQCSDVQLDVWSSNMVSYHGL